MTNGFERRKHDRKKVPDSVLVSSDWSAVNLSESGMLLASRDQVLVGSQINLQLNIDGELLEVSAKIVRCEMSASVYESHYLSGVVFEGIGATKRLTLRRYIESLPV